MRDRAHQAFADFVSKFRYILIPDFGSEKGMFKKKKGGLSAWWRNKMSILAHPRLRKIIEYRATRLGNCVNDPSEACSTMLCECGCLHKQGMHISLSLSYVYSRHFANPQLPWMRRQDPARRILPNNTSNGDGSNIIGLHKERRGRG